MCCFVWLSVSVYFYIIPVLESWKIVDSSLFLQSKTWYDIIVREWNSVLSFFYSICGKFFILGYECLLSYTFLAFMRLSISLCFENVSLGFDFPEHIGFYVLKVFYNIK